MPAFDAVLSAPGIYRRPAIAASGFPRQRTDVLGLVGVAGPNRIGELVSVDDWRSYEEIYLRDARGNRVEPPAGAQLRDAVRGFFANGGARCWVVNIAAQLAEAEKDGLLDTMLGRSRRTGLELLLEREQVAIVALPELDAWVTGEVETNLDAPIVDQGRFQCCPDLVTLAPGSIASRTQGLPLFTPTEVLAAQREFLDRLGREKWRTFGLVTVPCGLTVAQVVAWRASLSRNRADADVGALYFPWVWVTDKPGQVPRLVPPLGSVAGVFARRDLTRGPHVAPANEPLEAVVGVERILEEEDYGQLNAAAVNALRAYPNRGVEVSGARTLAYGMPDVGGLGYVNVRRCLSAIERNCQSFGQNMAFEPNQAMTRFVLTQMVTHYLTGVFKAGALQGKDAAASFFVRCDASNNPPAMVEAGALVCEVGVAIAAPTEFIVFRLGRREGVVEIEERSQ